MRIGLPDLEDDVVAALGRAPHRADPHAANLFHRPLGTPVPRTDEEHDRVDEAEGVAKHQTLELAVVAATPVRSRQKRPADLDLAARLVIAEVARRSDDAAGGAIDHREGAARLHRALKEALEDLFLVSIRLRMQLPDARVGGDGIELIEVAGPQWPELEQRPRQRWLEFERHRCSLVRYNSAVFERFVRETTSSRLCMRPRRHIIAARPGSRRPRDGTRRHHGNAGRQWNWG